MTSRSRALFPVSRDFVENRRPMLEHPTIVAEMMRACGGRRDEECWPWLGARSGDGYGIIQIFYRQFLVTRVLLGIEWAPEGLMEQAAHSCDNPPCVNPAHLSVKTAAENQHEKRDRGRAARGTDNAGGSKLTPDDVRAIRERLGGTESYATIARDFSVSRVLIGRIHNRKAWAWLT